jgi:ATP-binding cassette subfamily B protein
LQRLGLHESHILKSWAYLKHERRFIVLLGVLSFVTAQAESVTLLLMGLIAAAFVSGTDAVPLQAGPLDTSLSLAGAIGTAVACLILASALVVVSVAIGSAVRSRLKREQLQRVLTSHAETDWEHQSSQKASRLHGRLRLTIGYSSAFASLTLWSRSCLTIATLVVVSLLVSPAATILAVLLGVGLSLAIFPLRRRLTRMMRATAALEVKVGDDVTEAVDQGADVHVFGAWPEFLHRFSRRARELAKLERRSIVLGDLMITVYQYGALLLVLIAMGVAAATQESLAGFAGAALLMLRTLQYGQSLQAALRGLAFSVPYIEQYELELESPKPRMPVGEEPLERIHGLELRNVSYRYPGAEQDALEGVSLKLEAGSIVGLAGPSGSGKSTLGQILLRLRWPTAGHYLVNGKPACDFANEAWTHQVAVVPQKPRLLHGTLEENVRYVGGTAAHADVLDALESIGLGDLVASLPQGLQSELGPTTRNLSGGQEQRIGVARVLVRTPSLIVLDEPTSALDADAERSVVDALRQLGNRSGLIVVVIAHRMSTLALCDEVYYLESGRLVQGAAAVQPSDDAALVSLPG